MGKMLRLTGWEARRKMEAEWGCEADRVCDSYWDWDAGKQIEADGVLKVDRVERLGKMIRLTGIDAKNKTEANRVCDANRGWESRKRVETNRGWEAEERVYAK